MKGWSNVLEIRAMKLTKNCYEGQFLTHQAGKIKNLSPGQCGQLVGVLQIVAGLIPLGAMLHGRSGRLLGYIRGKRAMFLSHTDVSLPPFPLSKNQ